MLDVGNSVSLLMTVQSLSIFTATLLRHPDLQAFQKVNALVTPFCYLVMGPLPHALAAVITAAQASAQSATHSTA